MSLRHTPLRAVAATTLTLGALFAAGGTASAAPSQPTDQQGSDLQTYLDSLTNAYDKTIGRSVNEARDSAIDSTQANIGLAIGVPIANGAIGGVTAVAGSAASAATYAIVQNAFNKPASAAAVAPAAASLPALSAPAAVPAPAVGLPGLPPPPPVGLPGLPPPPPVGLPGLPPPPPVGLPGLPPPPAIAPPPLPPPPWIPFLPGSPPLPGPPPLPAPPALPPPPF
ncbi:hypothetical protein [Mycolicibacterium sp. P1-5]|uniref:hypothetical protein n=1 Tax=Mycolicibacterium sp. P1-5 TaxID=2024617 RepID=UPI0011ED6BCC|nr:hypothetical protein [Mycolicibacterium sp. P1-5]